MADLVNYRLRVVTLDGRQFTGTMLAFDKHMNLVLSDTEEFRVVKNSGNEVKRTMGLVILRGETVVSVTVEAPPTNEPARAATIPSGPGQARPVSRTAGAGLTAPVGAPPGFVPGFGN